MTAQGRLADYLRARRDQVQPHEAGLMVGTSGRRVPGLRREEVAVLAGISTDYYLRLEQGRDRNPSDHVLDALARALLLDAAATSFLHGLTRSSTSLSTEDHGDEAGQTTQWLIDSWPLTAAFVHSRYTDVLASNSLARALNPNYRAGVNSIHTLLTDPAERAFRDDWEGVATRTVALLRGVADNRAGDARLAALIARISESSALFRELWKRQDVMLVQEGVHSLHHPLVGDLTLTFMRLPLVATDGQSLFLYFAPAGTPSAAKMELLAQTG